MRLTICAELNLDNFLYIFEGKLEADNAPLSLVYEAFVEMFESYKNDRLITSKIQKRWDFIKHDVHKLSYVLTPKFASSDTFIEDKIDEIGTITAFVNRTEPNLAQETFVQLVEYVHDMCMLTGEKKQKVEALSASQFWDIYGKDKYPLVHKCAKRINAMSPSSAASERAWSILGFLHNSLRNKLANDKVEKLVFLYMNSGYLDEQDKEKYIFEDGISFHGEDFDE